MSSNVNSILIIGLGMIGSSIALAAKSKGITVYGFDIDDVVVNDAIKKDIIDRDAGTIEEISSKESAKNIDLIIQFIILHNKPYEHYILVKKLI